MKTQMSGVINLWTILRKGGLLLHILNNFAWVLVILFYAVFAILRPAAIFNIRIVIFLFYVMTINGLLVLAQSIALISGNFDISIDRITAFVAITVAKLLVTFNINPYLGILLAVMFGILCGAFNGFLVGILRFNPFVSTLATSMVFSGLLLVVSSTSIWHLPRAYLYVGQNMGVAILVFFLILIFFWFFFRYTKFGRHIYAVGGNPSAAPMLGINTRIILFLTYCIIGGVCGIAALFYTGFNGSAPTNMATGALFPAFAGAVLGGISLRGGRGSVVNAFAGALLIGIINAGLAMFAVAEPIRVLTTGLMVIIAIVIGSFRETLREKVSRNL